jgi:hypothetical protein
MGTEFGLLLPDNVVTGTDGKAKVPFGEWKINFLFLLVSQSGYHSRGFDWNRNVSQEDMPPSELTIELAK